MSMLKYFFDMNEDNGHLFQGLNVETDKEMMELQGRFPVIYLSFRGCSGLNIETTLNSVITEVKREFLRHEYIKNNLSDSYQKVFDAF